MDSSSVAKPEVTVKMKGVEDKKEDKIPIYKLRQRPPIRTSQKPKHINAPSGRTFEADPAYTNKLLEYKLNGAYKRHHVDPMSGKALLNVSVQRSAEEVQALRHNTAAKASKDFIQQYNKPFKHDHLASFKPSRNPSVKMKKPHLVL